MEKEKVLQILNELTKNMHPMRIDVEDYAYLESEHQVEYFSYSSSTDESVLRVKEVLDNLTKELLNEGNNYDSFVMIVEYSSRNPLLISEIEPIHDFFEKFIKDRKLCWGLSEHDGIEGVKITLVASR